MQLVVWNSQGAKWDQFWGFASPLMAPGVDVVGMVVESGWAPWVQSGDVFVNAGYTYNWRATWFTTPPANTPGATFCAGVSAKRGRFCFWVPWVNDPGAFQTNSRCSMGGLFLPSLYQGSAVEQFIFPGHKRPVIRFRLTKGGITVLTVLLVHLISGYWQSAQAELDDLVATMSTLIPQGTPGVIVGDMNINLINIQLTVPNLWRILQTNGATQQSGGNLDWALLYDPNQQLGNASANVVLQYKTGANQSDHSVLRYYVPT